MAKRNTPRRCRICKNQRLLANLQGRVCYECEPEWRKRLNAAKQKQNARAEAYPHLSLFSEECAICGREPGSRRLHVDHCHETGLIRGLLCSRCNSGIGLLRDDPELLKTAYNYLVHFQKKVPKLLAFKPEPIYEDDHEQQVFNKQQGYYDILRA